MIEIENFSKKYNLHDKNFSVKNVCIRVNDGQIAALLGPNGSGKSTLIKSVCGFHYPTEGYIKLSSPDGQHSELNASDLTGNPMQLCGYVPEKANLPQNMYVYNFLYEKASCHKNITEPQKTVNEIIKSFSLEDAASKKISGLSKGFQQRVSFAQALIHNPSNLILDEPFSGLDPAQSAKIRDSIKRLAAKRSILISTHNFAEIRDICSKIYILNKGLIVAEGTESEILKKTGASTLEQAFITLTGNSSEEVNS